MVLAAKVHIRDWSCSVYRYLLSGLNFHVIGYQSWRKILHIDGVPGSTTWRENCHGLCHQTVTFVDIGTGWTLLETTDHSLHST